MKSLTYIDLFAGAGGLSEGFINEGFQPIAHVEIEAAACKTLETRSAYHTLKARGDLKYYNNYLKGKISRAELISIADENIPESVINLGIGAKNNPEIFRKIDALVGEEKVDLIVGGPPCQAYSVIGRARDKSNMQNDHRNFLYKDYAKFLRRYKPKVFVFENVLGLLTAKGGAYFKNMKKYFRSIGYIVDEDYLNSGDFGVVQNRDRVILIGWRKELSFSYPDFDSVPRKWKVNDVLKDLLPIGPGYKEPVSKYAKKTNKYLKNFELRNGVNFVTQHMTRRHNDRDLEIYSIAIDKWMNEGKRLKYSDLPGKLKTHKNESVFTDRFKVVDPKGYCHTMVAHISKDGHHYIHPDSKQLRSLSIREAARIQSFPDNYYFEGGQCAAFKQIGNAVPPLMAKEIAHQISKQLCQI